MNICTKKGSVMKIVTDDSKAVCASGENASIEVLAMLPKEKVNEDSRSALEWIYTGKDELSSLRTVLNFEEKNFGYICKADIHSVSETSVCEFDLVFTNKSAKDVMIAPSSFFKATVNAKDRPVITQIKKESGHAENIKVVSSSNMEHPVFVPGTGIYNTAAEKCTRISSWVTTFQDFNSSGYYPMFYIQHDGHGEFIALAWSSGRVFTECDGDLLDVFSDLSVGAEAKEFITKVKAGADFVFPSVYFGCYSGDIEDGSNYFKRWFFENKAPAKLRNDENEPLIQIDMQMSPEDAKRVGIESLKWDYGWWPGQKISGPWKSFEGIWSCLDENSVPDGLKQSVIDTKQKIVNTGANMRKSGLNWTVYTLLHGNNDETDSPVDIGEFNAIRHPEWFSDRKITTGMGNSADLGNEECVSFLKKALLDHFKNNGMQTWRTDFEPICCRSDKENRHLSGGTDVQYWCTRGFEEIVDYLYENYPDFRYESCSSGGSMKDLFTAQKAVVINCDDLANYLSLRTTFYDSSYCIHPTQLQLPCNSDTFCLDCDLHCYPKYDASLTEEVKDMGMKSMMIGAFMSGSWCGPEGIKKYGLDKLYDKFCHFYAKCLRPLIRHGDLYHILPRPDGINWDGIQYADKNSESSIKAALYTFKPSVTAPKSVNVKLRGLFSDRKYKLTYALSDREPFYMTGKDLMTNGITVYCEKVGAEIILAEEVPNK